MAATKTNGSTNPAQPERPSTSAPASSGATPRVIHAGDKGRILCVADIRGDYHELNKLIREHEATAVIHVGDFGFMDAESVPRMSDKIIRHILQYSPLLPPTMRSHRLSLPLTGPNARQSLIEALNNSSLHFPLSQFPHLLSGAITFPVPVFTVYGLIEDVRVLERFRTGEYEVQNLHLIDEVGTRCLETGGVKLRLFGLGGAMAMHKLFDCGEGSSTIAGAQGTMWSTALQIGELLETAQRVYDPSETRIFVSSSAVGRNGIFSQICRALKADLTISAGLHFRYTVSFNEHSVCADFSEYQQKLLSANSDLNGVYQSVREKVDASMTEYQHGLLRKVLDVVGDIPDREQEEKERSMTNIWHWSLSDTSCGQMVLALGDGRVSAELKSTGLNFSHRMTQSTAPPSGPLPAPNVAPVVASKPVADTNAPAVRPAGPVPAGPRGAAGASSGMPARPNLGGPAGGLHNPLANGIRGPNVRPNLRGPNAPGGSLASGPGPAGANSASNAASPGAGGLARQPHGPQPGGAAIGRPPRPPMGGAGSTAPAAVNAGPNVLNQSARPPMGVRPPRPTGQAPANLSSANAQPVRPPQNQAPSQAQGQGQGLTKAPSSVPAKPSTPSNKNAPGASAPTKDVRLEKKEEPKPAPKEADKPKEQPAARESTPSGAATGTEDKSTASGDTSGVVQSASQEGYARPSRNKWSLFLRNLPVPVSETEIKEAFGESKSKITFVKLVFDRFGAHNGTKQKPIAYADFSSEEDMNEALKVELKIKDTAVSSVVSNPPIRGPRGEESGRGRGAPRGARGGRGGRGGAPGFGRKDSEGGERKEGGAPGGEAEKKAATPAPEKKE